MNELIQDMIKQDDLNERFLDSDIVQYVFQATSTWPDLTNYELEEIVNKLIEAIENQS